MAGLVNRSEVGKLFRNFRQFHADNLPHDIEVDAILRFRVVYKHAILNAGHLSCDALKSLPNIFKKLLILAFRHKQHS